MKNFHGDRSTEKVDGVVIAHFFEEDPGKRFTLGTEGEFLLVTREKRYPEELDLSFYPLYVQRDEPSLGFLVAVKLPEEAIIEPGFVIDLGW